MYFKNRAQEVPEILSTTWKTNQNGSPKFFPTIPKTKQKPGFTRFLQTKYFIIKTKVSSRFFKLLQKPDTRVPEVLSNYFKNKPRFFQTTLKKTQGIPQILSNYFKNQTQGFPEIFQTALKTRHKIPRHSFKLFQRQDTRDPGDSFKLL